MSASSRERPHRDQRTRMLEEPVPRLVLTLAVPTCPFFVVTKITPNEALAPYMAAEDASFNTEMDSTTRGLILSRLPSTPSIRTKA